jgi:flagellar protein FlaI
MAFELFKKKEEEKDPTKLTNAQIIYNLKEISQLSTYVKELEDKEKWVEVNKVLEKIASIPVPELEEEKKFIAIEVIKKDLLNLNVEVDFFKQKNKYTEKQEDKADDRGKAHKTKNLEEAKNRFPHLKAYTDELERRKIKVNFVESLGREMGGIEYPNVMYPVGDPIFIHIYREHAKSTQYIVIEPRLNEEEKTLFEKILAKFIDIAYREAVPDKILGIKTVLLKLLDETIEVSNKPAVNSFLNISNKIQLSQDQYDKIKYYLIRNRIGYGKLEPLFYDPYLEDIHCTGVGRVATVHKIFETVYTNIEFKDDDELNKYVSEVTERVERPASDRRSVVDAIMPDGSRCNFIYGREISQEGSSFTVRKFASSPTSVTQLIFWGTINSQIAAYLWLALENGMNLFVCGETASGKTTTLNAISAFIKPDAKVFTVENTPEVTMPHKIWQHLVTRESGKEGAGKETDVSYQDLLIAALRSRPNYIIVGEIRGVEGSIAFQAMQTGHPVMSTFHAGNVITLIQRLTGNPINIPITFMDNLNLCLIQQAVFNGKKFVRRVLSLTELERYYAPANKVITREVFTRNPILDKLMFRGLFNSYILEQKIAKTLGYSDPRRIYAELDQRARILEKMVELKIFDYFQVWDIICSFHNGGLEALPFKIEERKVVEQS